ncbi:MAG TPA: hypothetical protein VGO66_05820 [Solirubrobacterales bacterium]|jgi:hypothetical protein|nr:hypothetical protein [Solirubrobacterales bacterium]
MATTETMQMPTLGEQGEPCAGCGAQLAADQRYCLNCGQRRAGPRVDYRRYLAAPAAADVSPQAPAGQAPSAAVEPEPEPARRERDFAPLAAVGGIAVLGLMLLVGVLIGKGDGSTTTSAPAPIVRVGGEVPGATASADAAEPEEATSSKAKGTKKSKQVDTGAKEVEGGLTGSAAQHSDATVQASADDLNDLESQSGEAYEEAVKKLPDKIATPGAPPPIDTSKAPGGGGAAESIE